MIKIRDKTEKAYKDSAHADSGEDALARKEEEHDTWEDILTAIAMAEGGDGEYAKRLHPPFHIRKRTN